MRMADDMKNLSVDGKCGWKNSLKKKLKRKKKASYKVAAWETEEDQYVEGVKGCCPDNMFEDVSPTFVWWNVDDKKRFEEADSSMHVVLSAYKIT